MKRMKRMKKDRGSTILVFIFFIGLSVVLYPFISDYWNSRTQSRAIATYSDTVAQMDETDYEALLEEANEYNRELLDLSFPFVEYESLGKYEKILDISGTGIMGYVTIPILGVELPIYHGTDEGVLQVAAGHLSGSSFPVGGVGTHAVISAHRGLPSAKLFSDLDEMMEGDIFTITVLNQTIAYEVDQIRIVLPEEVEELQIDADKDYCTLMTCTPYGINSHRLLVRGIRTDAPGLTTAYVPADATQINSTVVSIALAIPMVFILLIILLIDQRRVDKKSKKKPAAEEAVERIKTEGIEK
ncbi:class C sortase [Roseburia hominis]